MITVLAFAQLREAFQTDQLKLELERSTLSELRTLLEEQFPEAKNTLKNSRFALNQSYQMDESTPVKSGDEIALIPPVSGG